jgi:hypothetical protein
MALTRITLLALTIALGGCARQPRITSTATPGTDFTKYRTYAIKPGNVAYPGASDPEREAIAQRIQDAVAMELEGRGLVPQPEGPDVVVTYTAGAREVGGDAAPVRAPVGVDVRGPAGGGYDEPGAVTAREWPDAAADMEGRGRYREGTLVIDLLDGQSRHLVWRATATLELASDRGGRMIGPTVSRAFESLPLGTRAR